MQLSNIRRQQGIASLRETCRRISSATEGMPISRRALQQRKGRAAWSLESQQIIYTQQARQDATVQSDKVMQPQPATNIFPPWENWRRRQYGWQRMRSTALELLPH